MSPWPCPTVSLQFPPRGSDVLLCGFPAPLHVPLASSMSPQTVLSLLIALSSLRAMVAPVTFQEGLLLWDLGVFSVSALYSPPSSSTQSLQACARFLMQSALDRWYTFVHLCVH